MHNQDYIKLLPISIVKNDIDSVQGKIWSVSANQYDDIETITNQLDFLGVIDKQEGLNLDNLGVLLGQLRNGLTDEQYRPFLKVAIKRYLSIGDIFSINELGKAVGISPLNIVENGDVLRLDGLWLLNGLVTLSGEELPQQFSFFRNLSVNEDIDDFLDIAILIEAARAAGVFANIYFNMDMLASQMLDYTQVYTGVLDGSWLLDSELALSGDGKKVYTPNYIAVGDGAEPAGLRPPEPGDTGLQNEVLRKVVFSREVNGVRIHTIEIERAELDGITINELAIFWDNSPILIGSFTGKLKNNITKFIFNIKEN